MAKVLLINIDGKKGIRIKNLCRKLYFESMTISKRRSSATRWVTCSAKATTTPVTAGADFDEEMLYLVDLDGGMLNIFLNQLRRLKVPVGLKAVKTQTNVGFTAFELYRELSAEREAIAAGMQAHPTG